MDTKQFIEQLSEGELRAYTIAFIEQEKEAGGKLRGYIQRQLNTVGIANAEVSVEQSFNTITNVGDKWHANWVRDWSHIYRDSYSIFERARNAIASGNPDTALAIGMRWLECFADTYDEAETYYFDDEDVLLGISCENAMKIIEEAIIQPDVSDNAKKDIAKRLQELSGRRNTPFGEYYFLDIDGLATRVNALSLGDEDALAYLDGMLADDFNNTNTIKQKYGLLLKMGRQQEAETFIEENLDNHSVADYYITQLLEANLLEKLIPILEDLTDPEYETHTRPTRRWLKILAECQDRLGLNDDAITTYTRLFVDNHGNLEYYHALKKHVSQDIWPEYLNGLIRQTGIDKSDCYCKSSYADILAEEGRHNELHDWLKTKSERAFATYLHQLPQEMRADLLPIYSKLILEAARRAKQRSSYARVCEHIAIIKSLPEGQPIANEIAAIIKQKYSTRPAFIDELRKALAK